MPTSRGPVRPHRTLSVLVTELAICDGEVAPPEVGEIGQYWLLFAETPPDAGDPSIVTVEVDVEPLDDGVPLRQPAPSPAFPDEERWWEWRLFLRGDGWTATWYSRRPTVGRQRLTGRLFGDLGYATTGSATGRILRARVSPTVTRCSNNLPPNRNVTHGGSRSPAPGHSGKWRRRPECSATTPTRRQPSHPRRTRFANAGCWSTSISTMCRHHRYGRPSSRPQCPPMTVMCGWSIANCPP